MAEFLTHLTLIDILGIFLVVAVTLLFVYMAYNKGSTFDFSEMFQEGGKTSLAKFLGFIGGLAATWIVLALTVAGKMTESYLTFYLGIMVAGKVASQWLESRNNNPDRAAPKDDAPRRPISEG